MKTPDAKTDWEDVAVLPPARDLELTLDDVSLENVQMQVLWQGRPVPARGHAGVSLIDKKSRGIHMSRLFRILTALGGTELNWSHLNEAVDGILTSHQGLSDSAYVEVAFEATVARPSLLSGETGWRAYPLRWRVEAGPAGRRCRLTARVLYSSTCPCSASLSRQALQDSFAAAFSSLAQGELSREKVMQWLGRSESIPAMAHAQRSEATVELVLTPETAPGFPPLQLIDEVEAALGTPVQAAVKREDEQEFARLNARNLMFCEDAARKLKAALLKRADLEDFNIEVRHFESLHPHDVVARAAKKS